MDYETEQKHHTAFERPNYTQTPNLLFDSLMKEMGEAELKVTLCIIRKIIGYHKFRPEAVSLSQIQKMTGLSRKGAIAGLNAALNRGIIKRAGEGKRGVALFQIAHEGDEEATSNPSTPVIKMTSYRKLPVTSNPSTPTKEKVLKKKDSPLPPEGEELALMQASVKKLLKQYKQASIDNIAKTLLCLHTGKKIDMNLSRPITVKELESFCEGWSKRKDGQGNPLSMPANMESIHRNVQSWLDTLDAKKAKNAQNRGAGVVWGYVPYTGPDPSKKAGNNGKS